MHPTELDLEYHILIILNNFNKAYICFFKIWRIKHLKQKQIRILSLKTWKDHVVKFKCVNTDLDKKKLKKVAK